MISFSLPIAAELLCNAHAQPFTCLFRLLTPRKNVNLKKNQYFFQFGLIFPAIFEKETEFSSNMPISFMLFIMACNFCIQTTRQGYYITRQKKSKFMYNLIIFKYDKTSCVIRNNDKIPLNVCVK